MRPFLLVVLLAACSSPELPTADAGPMNVGCDLSLDEVSNCGSCGHVCQVPNATPSCKAGACGVKSCLPGFRDADGVLANGCETSCQPLVVSTTGNLDFDVAVVRISGRVTMGGQAAPAGTSRGSLRFESSGSSTLEVALPASGVADYAGSLFAGKYRVLFVKSADCRADALPCGTQLLDTRELTASGVIDFDVPAATGSSAKITVSGSVTSHGAALGAGPKGSVVFASDAGSASGALSATGYSVELSPGVYDVLVEGSPLCPAGAVLPCQRSVQKRAVSLTTSGTLDLDLPIVAVSGSVTVNGQTMAGATAERGRLSLVDANGNGPSVSLGTSGAAQWSTLVYAGPHDVVVSRVDCAAASPLPCQSLKALSQVAVTSAGVLDVDLKPIDFSGEVRANGKPLTAGANGASRGALIFKATPADARPSVELGSSGAATFQMKLYAGSYDLWLDNATDCANGALPCGARKVKSVAITAAGVLDVDVPTVHVSGSVTVNGAQAPTARGTLSFDGPTKVSADVTGSWAATLYPGTHKVTFGNTFDCATGPVPCQKRLIDAARSFTADGALTVDLPVIEVTGALTHNGQGVAASTSARGELEFREPLAGSVAVSLGQTGAATYRVRLFPSSYQVLFANTTDCPASDGQPLPCQGAVEIASNVLLAATGLKDFNLSSVTLTGNVQVNGAPMPASASGQSRGLVRFASFGATPVSRALGPAGAASYQLRLVPGRYDVGIENTVDCQLGALPCQRHLIAGCQTP